MHTFDLFIFVKYISTWHSTTVMKFQYFYSWMNLRRNYFKSGTTKKNLLCALSISRLCNEWHLTHWGHLPNDFSHVFPSSRFYTTRNYTKSMTHKRKNLWWKFMIFAPFKSDTQFFSFAHATRLFRSKLTLQLCHFVLINTCCPHMLNKKAIFNDTRNKIARRFKTEWRRRGRRRKTGT